MKKVMMLWNSWKSKFKAIISGFKGEKPVMKSKIKPTFSIGSVERFDTTPKKTDEKLVRLGSVNESKTVRLGETSYDLPKTRIAGQDGVLDGDGEPEFEYELTDNHMITEEEIAAYRFRMGKD